MSANSVSLSKKNGSKIFKVYGKSKDKGDIYKIDTDFEGEKVIREYKTPGLLQLLPAKKMHREVIVISGPSGAGKSTFAVDYIKEYKKINPNNTFYLISPKEDDEAVNELNPNVIDINTFNFIEDPIPLEELEDSILLCDDCESITDPTLKKAVEAFMDAVMIRGRSLNITILVITHLISNYKQSRVMLNECHSIVLFPKAGSTYHIRTYLTKCGLSRQQVDRIIALPSRWVVFHKCAPQYVMGEHDFYFI